MTKIRPLNYLSLRKKIKVQELGFKSTREVKPLKEFVGQERAVAALTFGMNIKAQGYNLYVMGPSGIGKRSLTSRLLTHHALRCPVPDDWCYVHNFETPEKPIALKLPAGVGNKLQHDMKKLVENLATNILTVFESDDYRLGIKRIADYYEAKRNQSRREEQHLKIDKTPKLYKEQNFKERKFQQTSVVSVVKPMIKKMKKKYKRFIQVIDYLNAVKKDMILHANDFFKPDEKSNFLTFSIENPVLTKYKVNVLVDNSKLEGAPVIFEQAPSYSSLICRIEHTTQQGALATNFTLIRPGDLHHANGGYLIIEARKLKKNQDAWEALKSALYARRVIVKPVEHEADIIKPISLEPMPIPLDVKVVLLGDRNTYYSLCQHDQDFRELFKVAVDFDEEIERHKKNIKLYARLIGTIIKKKKLRPFQATAVAEVIDHSSRIIEDNEKLSTHIRSIEDLILEANYWAECEKRKIVEASDVKKAIQAYSHRMGRAKLIYHEDIKRNFIIIKTAGKTVGQVNCLSVRKVGDFSYGHPTRVTARIRIGKGKLIDIQREIKMAGPMHSKAGLIIATFLASRFNQDYLFSLSASIAFEQVYCWTDGDSASVGELCALLSCIADIPLFQHLAITGSVDQYGEVQAVGGVNEKIEGFFDVCKERDLNGKQGVIIPAINAKNLMLREDIVEAARKNKFFIYPVRTIDEAIYLLTDIKAGTRNKKGQFPLNTIYHRVEEKLKKFSQTLHKRK